MTREDHKWRWWNGCSWKPYHGGDVSSSARFLPSSPSKLDGGRKSDEMMMLGVQGRTHVDGMNGVCT